MSSKGTGLTLMLGILAAIVGYIMIQMAIGMDTKVDDIPTILANSSSNGANIGIALVLIAVGLTIHAAGLMNTRGTAAGTAESIGIYCIMTSIIIWVVSTAFGFALIEMGDKFISYSAGAAQAAQAAQAAAAAGDAATAAGAQALAEAAAGAATTTAIAAGFTQAASVASNTIGSLLAGIGWISLGLAYRGSDAKGALSFIPLWLLAIIAGLILVVSNLVINQVVDMETASSISGISFLLIVLWSVSRGLALINGKKLK
jgi:hypothetical protein